MLEVERVNPDAAIPLRITFKVGEAGTAASIPVSIANNSVSFAYYFVSSRPQPSTAMFIVAEDYPALARVWDNDADAIYDNL